MSVNQYIILTDKSAIFQISDIGVGWHSTDINIGYWISANDIGHPILSDIMQEMFKLYCESQCYLMFEIAFRGIQ